jgi:hypothetical protein
MGDKEMKVNFISKTNHDELIPQDEFVIEKEIILEETEFNKFIHNPLGYYDFIKGNTNLMYCDTDGVYHCIYITSNEHDFGILIESEGYHYARYTAYLPKSNLGSQ